MTDRTSNDGGRVETIQLDIDLLLPDLDDEDEHEYDLITQWLEPRRGIERAHVLRENGHARLCLHYDPTQMSLARVERLAREAGARFTERYRHETIRFEGMDAADTSQDLGELLDGLPGMLHARASYAAGLLFVAYDSTILSRETIEETVRAMGAELLGAPELDPDDDRDFLPLWLRDRRELLYVAVAGLLLATAWLGERYFGLPRAAAGTLYLLSYLAGGYEIATHAVPGLFRGRFNTDVLMLAAAIGAAILGEFAEGAFLLFLFSLGHAGEHYALDRARNAINALGELMPRTARVLRDGRAVELPVERIAIGDRVVVRPGDRVPVDGVVRDGESSVDQSPITGESVPVAKRGGDELFAGTINHEGALEVEVTRRAEDNTLARVMALVAEAQSQQSPTQQLTDRFTRWFVPTILVATALLIVVPPLAGWMAWETSFYRGMLLLVAASPCALAIGTPAAVLAGIAQAARNGVLIKGGAYLEHLGGLRAMAFDKSGTITEGRFEVTELRPAPGTTAERLLSVAAAGEQLANHPLAAAILREAARRGIEPPAAVELESLTGRGIRATLDGAPLWIGALRLYDEPGSPEIPEPLASEVGRLEEAGRTTMIVAHDARVLGLIALADRPREGAATVLARLRELGVAPLVMLTGDNRVVAERVAAEVGLTDVRAGLLPEEKLEAIRALVRDHGTVGMAGDGVNDAPALATATVGIAMGGAGSAVALESADVVLMADDLSRLPFATGLGRASRAIIRQNLAISLGVIALLLVTSVFGLLELGGAVLLHEGSTVAVVLNALRLLVYRGR